MFSAVETEFPFPFMSLLNQTTWQILRSHCAVFFSSLVSSNHHNAQSDFQIDQARDLIEWLVSVCGAMSLTLSAFGISMFDFHVLIRLKP